MEAVEATLRGLKHLKSYDDLHQLLTTTPTEQLRSLGPAIAALISAEDVLMNLRRDASAAICPVCLARLVLVFDALPALAASTRLDCHALWDACVNLVTAQRSGAEVSAFKRKLMETADNCAVCPPAETQHVSRADRLFGRFIEDLFRVMNMCFTSGKYSLLDRARTDKGFRSRGTSNVWPPSPHRLMPRGEKYTFEALLGWACTLVCSPSIRALLYYFTVLRPQVFPHLLQDPLRPRFLWLLARLLMGDFREAIKDWPGEEPCNVANATVLEVPDALTHLASAILITLTSGPDARADDVARLMRGYEPALLASAQRALGRPSFGQHPMSAPMRDFVLVLHKQLRRPDSALPPDMRYFAQATLNPLVNPAKYRDTTTALALFFFHLKHRRGCAGPGCALALQDNQDGRPFQRCAKCRVVSYCGRECQTADWKQGLEVPGEGAAIKHRDVCPILSKVEPMLRTEDTIFAIFAEAFQELNLAAEEMRVLSDWARASRVLPPDVVAEMASTAGMNP